MDTVVEISFQIALEDLETIIREFSQFVPISLQDVWRKKLKHRLADMKTLYLCRKFLYLTLTEFNNDRLAFCNNWMDSIQLLVAKMYSHIADSIQQVLDCASEFEINLKLIKGAEEEAPRPHFPLTNLPRFIDSILEEMKSTSPDEDDSVTASKKDMFQTAQDDMDFLRSFLDDVLQRCDHDESLKALQSSVMMSIITQEIKLIKIEASKNSTSKKKLLKLQDVTKPHRKMLSIGRIQGFNGPIVGLDDEAEKIVDRLTRGPKQLDIVSIVGMAGLGKTNLAKKVFRHSIVHHFHARSWSIVSQVYNKTSLLLEILRGLGWQSDEEDLKKNGDDSAQILYKFLKGKRYLIILDDVWDFKAWGDLQISFANDANGSMILLTTRNENVGLQIKPHSQPPHSLRSLTNNKSWELFRMKMCFDEGSPSEIFQRGKAIAKRCKGLPLMIIVIAGLLSDMEPSEWEEIKEMVMSPAISPTQAYYTSSVFSLVKWAILQGQGCFFMVYTLCSWVLVTKNCIGSLNGVLYQLCQSKRLGVVDLRGICKFDCFPSIILLLSRLRYLALSVATKDSRFEIPSIIEQLSNLETMIIKGRITIDLPDTLWNMKKLRHLYSYGDDRTEWTLPKANPEDLFCLKN
ncbi:OLC1v1031041C1 [Oldenlandia corymbosa var. corymbosa]|uniref:OLC1v1031041C1 n=1 Tax=Oldenlandia corymbosa var. corymbosa TaxID=529605 RepID=A0AAV1CKZ2_OLDCO|nr:OLC1v1031041C1 [Oldenlandia corymbosa var. corymbosa]